MYIYMTKKWHLLNIQKVVDAYIDGVSISELSKQVGCSRGVITTLLTKSGVTVRSNAEANKLMMLKRTPEENARNVANAHEAAKTHVHTFDEKVKRAKTRMTKGLHIGPSEILFKKWFQELGVEAIPQFAIGPYNCDLAIGNTAIEIYGGSWHQTGRHAARSFDRYKYFFDNGWNVVIVWVDQRRSTLDQLVCNHIKDFINGASSKDYLVLWGNGRFIASGNNKPDEEAFTKALI
jgi:hypothetical protein